MPHSLKDVKSQTIALLGAPVGAGAGIRGAAMGPAALRTVDMQRCLEELGYTVRDYGDVDLAAMDGAALVATEKTRHLPVIASFARALSAQTYHLLKSQQFPIVMGGDHSLSMGSVSGVARACQEAGRPLYVLWLDAHADFNTPETSPSGNMHGMSLAMLCGEAGLDMVLGDQPRVVVKPEHVFLFGIRSVDQQERRLLSERGIHVVDMRRIDEFGVVHELRAILAEIAAHNGHLHVSFDADVLDPSLAPGTGTTVPGGATYREAHLIMEMLHDSGCVGSLDIVELNPILDERGKTAHVLVDLVASLFGRSIIDR